MFGPGNHPGFASDCSIAPIGVARPSTQLDVEVGGPAGMDVVGSLPSSGPPLVPSPRPGPKPPVTPMPVCPEPGS